MFRWRSLLFGSLVLAACSEPPPPPVEAVRPVKIVEVGAGAVTGEREWPGKVEPIQNADIAFEVAGKLIKLPVEEGQTVKKGQILAKIDPRDLQAALDAERAKLKQSKSEFERTKGLLEQGVVAKAEFDQKERFVSVNEASVRATRKALADATIRAPFAGTVARVHADNFQNVQAKEVIVTVQDRSALEIVTHLPERDVAAAKPGLSVEERNARIEPKAIVDAFPDRKLDAVLKEFSTAADAVTQTYAVTWKIDPPEDMNLLPGMSAKITLTIPDDLMAAGGFSLPAHAVLGADEGGAYVWKIDPSSMQAKRADVEIGALSGDQIAITGGLTGGDLVAVSGIHELRDGMEVSRYVSRERKSQ